MDQRAMELLEEYKYLDKTCREMYNAEKGVSAYIDQMDATPMSVRYRIAGWDDDYRQLKHIRWLRNQIAHSTGYVECTPTDLEWLRAFYRRLLEGQDPLAKARRVVQGSQTQKQQQQQYQQRQQYQQQRYQQQRYQQQQYQQRQYQQYQQQQTQQEKIAPADKTKKNTNMFGAPNFLRKSWILIAVIAGLVLLVGFLVWIANGWAR